MPDEQRADSLDAEALDRLARVHAERTGETLEASFEAVAERARRSQERERARDLAEQAAWESFMRTERREIALRRDGQLAEMLGEALPGESREALERLTLEDQRQATEGLVALMRNGALTYKPLEELCMGDMPARGAANRLRSTWLKERHDGWLASGRG